MDQQELLNEIFAIVKKSKEKPKKKINLSDEERQIRMNRLKKGRETVARNRALKKEAKANTKENEKQGEKVEEVKEEIPKEEPKVIKEEAPKEEPKVIKEEAPKEKPQEIKEEKAKKVKCDCNKKMLNHQKERLNIPKKVDFEIGGQPLPRKKTHIRFNINNPF